MYNPTPKDIAEMDEHFTEMESEIDLFFSSLEEGNLIAEDERFRQAHDIWND